MYGGFLPRELPLSARHGISLRRCSSPGGVASSHVRVTVTLVAPRMRIVGKCPIFDRRSPLEPILLLVDEGRPPIFELLAALAALHCNLG